MRITYDPTVDAIYIYFVENKRSTRTEEVGDDILIDYSGKKPIGIEILDASDKIANRDLKNIEALTSKLDASAFNKDWAKIRKWGKQTAKRMNIKTYDDVERIAG